MGRDKLFFSQFELYRKYDACQFNRSFFKSRKSQYNNQITTQLLKFESLKIGIWKNFSPSHLVSVILTTNSYRTDQLLAAALNMPMLVMILTSFNPFFLVLKDRNRTKVTAMLVLVTYIVRDERQFTELSTKTKWY